ncbi:MAG: glycosyltransferase [Hymenobacter sp.]|nr:MAG: glycosyltransferase [Hymenobacter sp.]
MNEPILTIAIPTYNRNEKVKRIIDILSPQLNSYVKIKIIDNCSSEPVANTIKDYLHIEGIEVVRNKVNVGMSGNFIKCFELCDTEWLWMLGDDDYPLVNAVEIVMSHLNQWPNSSFFNFNSFMSCGRSRDLSVMGVEELVKKLDSFGNLLCISLGVYNINKLFKGLRFAYQFGYSLAPQTAFLFAGLGDGQVILSNSELIDFSLHDTSPNDLWSWISLSLVIGVLTELPLNLSNGALKKFSEHLLTHVQPPEQLYSIIINNDHYAPKEKLRIFKMIYDRSTFGELFCARTLSFYKYYLKLWLYTLRHKQADIVDLSSHYKRIERI